MFLVLVGILNQFPIRILGELFLFVEIELALAPKDMNSKEEWFIILVYVVFFIWILGVLFLFVGIVYDINYARFIFSFSSLKNKCK